MFMSANTTGYERRAWFRALSELAGVPALLLDGGGRLEHANLLAYDLFECAGEAVLATKWASSSVLFGVPPASGTATVPVGDGSRRIGLELRALDAEAGGGYFALLKDRGRFDPLERELLLASECRAWTHESAVLLHDLKGILNSMQISLELMSDPDAEVTQLTVEEARRERRIVMLKDDLSRLNQGLRALPGSNRENDPPLEEFDARELLKEVLGTLRLLARRNNVEVKLDSPDAALPIRARRTWIRQALLNVATHRLNAMRAGGRLSVIASARNGKTGDVPGLCVRFGNDAPDLRDASAEELDRSFCPGRRNPGNTDLVVARAVFESAGGSLQILSDEAGQGSIVEMHIPA
jgi:signal transduction histidine kinase